MKFVFIMNLSLPIYGKVTWNVQQGIWQGKNL